MSLLIGQHWVAMVCISCFIAPLVLFIWYKFIYPILEPIVRRIWTDYQLPVPFANLTCPMPKKAGADAPTVAPEADHKSPPEVPASAPEDKKEL